MTLYCTFAGGCTNIGRVICPNPECRSPFCFQHCDGWTHGCRAFGDWVNSTMPTVAVSGTEGQIYLKHPILYMRLLIWLDQRFILGLCDESRRILTIQKDRQTGMYQYLLKYPDMCQRARLSPKYASLEALLDAMPPDELDVAYAVIRNQTIREQEQMLIGHLAAPRGVIDSVPLSVLRRLPKPDQGATVLLVDAMARHA